MGLWLDDVLCRPEPHTGPKCMRLRTFVDEGAQGWASAWAARARRCAPACRPTQIAPTILHPSPIPRRDGVWPAAAPDPARRSACPVRVCTEQHYRRRSRRASADRRACMARVRRAVCTVPSPGVPRAADDGARHRRLRRRPAHPPALGHEPLEHLGPDTAASAPARRRTARRNARKRRDLALPPRRHPCWLDARVLDAVSQQHRPSE